MTPFYDAIEIINQITDWLLFTSIKVGNNQSIDIIYLLMFVIIVGAVIFALANKEA